MSLGASRIDDPQSRALREAMALDASIAIARMLATEADLEAILDLIAKRGRALVSARAVVIELEEGGEMVVAAAAGEIPERLIGRSADPSFLTAEAGLVIPLTLRGRSYGALVAVGSEFSIEDEEMLEIFAASAVAAVAAMRLADLSSRRRRLAAREAERARWARELHEAIAGTEVDTGKLRSLITELRPPVLDELGVGAAIEALADRVESPAVEVQTRIELAFEKGRIETRHDEELERAAYRIVQEALDNAIRHARASCVAIEVVEGESGEMRITVRDNGRGFDPVTSSGFGLSGMRERAELFGGSLAIDSSIGEGTEVRAVIPLGRRPEDAHPEGGTGVGKLP